MSYLRKNELNRLLGRGYTKSWKCDNTFYPHGFDTFSLKFVIEKFVEIIKIQDIAVAPLYVGNPELKEMATDVLQGQGTFRWRFEMNKIKELIKVVNCTPEELVHFRSLELRDWMSVIPGKTEK